MQAKGGLRNIKVNILDRKKRDFFMEIRWGMMPG